MAHLLEMCCVIVGVAYCWNCGGSLMEWWRLIVRNVMSYC